MLTFLHFRLTNSMLSEPDYPAIDQWTYEHNFCFCPRITNSSSNSREKDASANCFEQSFATCTNTRSIQEELKSCVVRSKRSLDRRLSNEERLFQLSNLQFSERPKTRKKVLHIYTKIFIHSLLLQVQSRSKE